MDTTRPNNNATNDVAIEERIARVQKIWADFERELAGLRKEHRAQIEALIKTADQDKIKDTLSKLRNLSSDNN